MKNIKFPDGYKPEIYNKAQTLRYILDQISFDELNDLIYYQCKCLSFITSCYIQCQACPFDIEPDSNYATCAFPGSGGASLTLRQVCRYWRVDMVIKDLRKIRNMLKDE